MAQWSFLLDSPQIAHIYGTKGEIDMRRTHCPEHLRVTYPDGKQKVRASRGLCSGKVFPGVGLDRRPIKLAISHPVLLFCCSVRPSIRQRCNAMSWHAESRCSTFRTRTSLAHIMARRRTRASISRDPVASCMR